MKKLFLFFALLAGIAVMTGCQKDHDVVTLKAVMDQDTKAYFGGSTDPYNRLNLPYWDENDEVYVKGLSFARTSGLTKPNPTSPLTTFATIVGVPPSVVYSAIYPARIVESMDTPDPGNNATNTPAGVTATIYFNPHQFYKEEENHQRVDMPMGAVTTDETLIFKNLCSILRLTVSNSLDDIDFDVSRLTVQAFNAYIAGFGNVTLSEGGDPSIDMNTPHQSSDNVLSVYDENHHSMGTIYRSNTNGSTSKSFDIIVPPFTATKLVLEVEMYKHNSNNTTTPLGYYEYTIENPASVARNNIIPIDLEVDRYQPFDYAYLKSGPEFNAQIQTFLNNHPTVNAIKFNIVPGELTGITEANEWVEGSTPSGWIELQADYSPRKIYGYVDGTTLIINSFANSIYAHSNCSSMFRGLTNIVSIQSTQPQLFITEDVTNMAHMFAGCTNLGILEGITFNTTNVTTMAYMFEGCSTLQGLTLPFNTHHLRGDGMVGMFKNCSRLQYLNLSTFTTEQITNMTELFYNCSGIKGDVSQNGLFINQFVISNNTILTDMCTGLCTGQSQWDRGAIYCRDEVKPILLSQDENSNYITGINRNKVYFPLQGETHDGSLAK